jgi:nucleoside 2-deoxyribosyltransferase
MSESRPNMSNKTVNVFLSHDSADSAAARNIRTLINRHVKNARVFLDEDISVGESWKSKLRKAIKDADLIVALLTPASLFSSSVLQEVGVAWGLDKPILPIVNPRSVLNQFSLALSPETALDYRVLDGPKAGAELAAAFERVLSTHYTA